MCSKTEIKILLLKLLTFENLIGFYYILRHVRTIKIFSRFFLRLLPCKVSFVKKLPIYISCFRIKLFWNNDKICSSFDRASLKLLCFYQFSNESKYNLWLNGTVYKWSLIIIITVNFNFQYFSVNWTCANWLHFNLSNPGHTYYKSIVTTFKDPRLAN